jgi:hypothetical protein
MIVGGPSANWAVTQKKNKENQAEVLFKIP